MADEVEKKKIFEKINPFLTMFLVSIVSTIITAFITTQIRGEITLIKFMMGAISIGSLIAAIAFAIIGIIVFTYNEGEKQGMSW